MKTFLLICSMFAVAAGTLFADCNVVPFPQEYRENAERCALAILKNAPEKSTVETIDGVPAHALAEAYELKISPTGASVRATSHAGFLNAQKTIAQMIWAAEILGEKNVPACEIKDWPAFPYRAFMLDCGRSYFEIKDLKKIVEFLAERKINVFHWHLTENQGWRIESKAFPQLNEKKTYERHPGKFYSYGEIREFVDWCHARGVMVVPEIDMPGHSAAFKRAMGFDMQTDRGVAALKTILSEAFENGFPDTQKTPFFHIGTDEVRIANSEFVSTMIAHVRQSNRKVCIWNPGAKVEPRAVDMVTTWRPEGRALKDTLTLDGRFHYFNLYDPFADPAGLFFANLSGSSECDGIIGGASSAIWTDRNIESVPAILANNAFYHSAPAYAESVWRGGRKNHFNVTGTNIPLDGERLAEFKDFERRQMILKRELGKNFAWVPQADFRWRITEAFPNGGDLKKAFPPENDLLNFKNDYAFDGKIYKTVPARGAAVYLKHLWGSEFVVGFLKHPRERSTVYAQTYIYSPKAQKIGVYIQTHYYFASEPDLPPLQGKWDFCESKFWLNGEEILPPKWENFHTRKSQEISLKNENFTVRPPLPISLKQGWNAVLVKLPVNRFKIPQLREHRWMFTFAPVSLDGATPVADLVFSPERKIGN